MALLNKHNSKVLTRILEHAEKFEAPEFQYRFHILQWKILGDLWSVRIKQRGTTTIGYSEPKPYPEAVQDLRNFILSAHNRLQRRIDRKRANLLIPQFAELPRCPWCEKLVFAVPLNGSAIAKYGDVNDRSWRARNPAQCPECNHCAGWEDFYGEFPRLER